MDGEMSDLRWSDSFETVGVRATWPPASLYNPITHTCDLCPFTGNAETQALIKIKSEHKYCK